MKHAFLILAHNDFELLSRLLKVLDNADNKLYIHIDIKSNFSDMNKEYLLNCCKYSTVNFVERTDVRWGGYSLTNCQLQLLKRAVFDNCDYYHFISGVDFPIKSMSYIHEFFEKNAGYEFVNICSDDFTKSQINRIKLYHFFQEKCGRDGNFYSVIKRALLLLQKILKIDRTKKYPKIDFKMGSNWSSITKEFALKLIENESTIKKVFSNSLISDEMFMQTILYNSHFKNHLYNSKNLRHIDWISDGKNGGTPRVFTVNDYDELINSNDLFCRKVSISSPHCAELVKKLEMLNIK